MAKEAQARAPAAVRGLYGYDLRRFSQLAENAQDPDSAPTDRARRKVAGDGGFRLPRLGARPRRSASS